MTAQTSANELSANKFPDGFHSNFEFFSGSRSQALKLSKSACFRLIQPRNSASLQRRRVSLKRSASISLVGFFPSEILPSVTIACTQRNTVSMCFTRPSPRPASNRNSHPSLQISITSPGEYSEGPTFATLQFTQPIILRFTGAECDHGLTLALCANRTVSLHQRHSQKRCVTPRFCTSDTFLPPEQLNQPRTNSETTGRSLQFHLVQGLTVVATCELNLGIQLLSQVCHLKDTVHAGTKNSSIGNNPELLQL